MSFLTLPLYAPIIVPLGLVFAGIYFFTYKRTKKIVNSIQVFQWIESDFKKRLDRTQDFNSRLPIHRKNRRVRILTRKTRHWMEEEKERREADVKNS